MSRRLVKRQTDKIAGHEARGRPTGVAAATPGCPHVEPHFSVAPVGLSKAVAALRRSMPHRSSRTGQCMVIGKGKAHASDDIRREAVTILPTVAQPAGRSFAQSGRVTPPRVLQQHAGAWK
jgi:hypothetical protein